MPIPNIFAPITSQKLRENKEFGICRLLEMWKNGDTNKSDGISIDISDQVLSKCWMHTLWNMRYKPQYIPKLRYMGIFLLILFPIDSYFHSFIKLRVDYGVFYFVKLYF